jgi:hypothetical protein
MAAPALQKAIGGVTPGGVITVNPGHPIQLTNNLNLANSGYSLQCRQIGFSVDASPSGEVYVNYGNFAGQGVQTALIVQSGTTQSLPVGASTKEGKIDGGAWYVDGSAACKVAISFVDASS